MYINKSNRKKQIRSLKFQNKNRKIYLIDNWNGHRLQIPVNGLQITPKPASANLQVLVIKKAQWSGSFYQQLLMIYKNVTKRLTKYDTIQLKNK